MTLLLVCQVLLKLFLPRLVLFCHFLRDVGVALLLKFEFGLKVVLAVSLVDVLREGTVLGQKQERNVQGLCVVRLGVFLGDQFHVEQVFLQDEADLGGNAEVGRSDEHNFLQHRVLRQLVRVLDARVQLLLFHHVQVHHVADVQVENPVLRVLHSEGVAHIQFEPLVFLDVHQLFQGRERNLESLAPIPEIDLSVLLDHVLVSVDGRLLTFVFKLFDDTGELLKQRVGLNDERLENLDRLLDVDIPRQVASISHGHFDLLEVGVICIGFENRFAFLK